MKLGQSNVLHLSVILSTWGLPPPGQIPLGTHTLGTHPPRPHTQQAHTPLGRHPQAQQPLGRHLPWADSALRSACCNTVNKQAVRILPECNLVITKIHCSAYKR